MNIFVFFILAASLATSSRAAYVAFAADADPVCKTVLGQPCIFPFRYRGRTYHQCTHDFTTNGKPWCAYKVRSSGDAFPGKWEDCNTSVCHVEEACITVSGPDQGNACQFPFIYNGKTYNTCAWAPEIEKYWCSTKTDRFGKHISGQNFGFCDDQQPACGSSNITTPTTKKPVSSDCKCGQKKKDRSIVPFIVNGTKTLENEYPWQVGLALYFFRRFTEVFCGGTIISEKTILSAAHCAQFPAKSYVVLVGAHNRQGNPSSQYKKVCNIYNHPNYIPRNPFIPNNKNFDMDFSIIELCEPLTFSDKVQPVCLPDYQHDGTEFENLKHTVTGWGRTSYDGPSSDVLLETDVTTMSNDACCSSPYNWRCSFITSNMMCAAKPSTSACSGDSGGPLVTYSSSKKSHVLTGVVSWGHRECAKAEYPGVYARVSMVIDWIKGKMNGATCYKQR